MTCRGRGARAAATRSSVSLAIGTAFGMLAARRQLAFLRVFDWPASNIAMATALQLLTFLPEPLLRVPCSCSPSPYELSL